AAEPLEIPAPTDSGGDWLSSIGAPASETEATINDWSASELAEPEAAEPQAGDMPDWMRGMEPVASTPTADTSQNDWMPPEAQDEFNKLLEGAAKNRQQSRETKETGILDASALPDWLNAVGDSPAAPSFGEAEYTGEAGTAPSVSMALAD